MKEIKETCYKGTRILIGDKKRNVINNMIKNLKEIYNDFTEIQIPIIQYQELFANKVGEENNNMMFNFQDRAQRNICLAPEYTAIVQQLAKTTYKYQKNVMLFYIAECFRGEKPQLGRFRQFTQFGVEILNPDHDFLGSGYNLQHVAMRLLTNGFTEHMHKFQLNENVSRGLDYYENGKGFEIICKELGAAKQIVGGGSYDGGQGFAIGVDRLLLI